MCIRDRAYTIQSLRPHPESGRHYYYRPKAREGGEPVELTLDTVRRHLAGELTIGIYAINPSTQRSKWMAIDADYKQALEDLIKVQRQLKDDGIDAGLEKSRRGGHLWFFFETPVLARDARIYIHHVASTLDVHVKGRGLADGIEIFPKQDQLRPEEFGNAIRAPLGVHWGARESRGWRYWYYGADYNLDDQLAYLKGLKRVQEEHLQRMIAGKTFPAVSYTHLVGTNDAQPTSKGGLYRNELLGQVKVLCGKVGFGLGNSVLQAVAKVDDPERIRDMAKMTAAFEKLEDCLLYTSRCV